MVRFRSALPGAERAHGKARLAATMAQVVKETDPISALDGAESLAEQAYKELGQRYVWIPLLASV